ncbi:hypothetical protein HJA97_05785 [Rhizobium binae]|nr:hypothetical protein [Rhizobium binae]MBX5154292.1 hypothetical protein [Rhizobium lentis]NKL49602.1 hypothetical protein [Rhizobium leguminosarum bv. viciae]MBX4943705.1 hypothetical protein [Rhizobium binae]MBX4979149.1 hypothetical protein [Rhizobium binae]
MIDKSRLLEEILEAMVADDEDISVRAVCGRSDGVFRHATDITRIESRRGMVEAAIKKQKAVRSVVERSSKKSPAELERLAAMKTADIGQLQTDKELLIASHRAMILAIAETGGFPAWKRFFEGYQAAVDRLEKIGSLPEASVISLSPQRDA